MVLIFCWVLYSSFVYTNKNAKFYSDWKMWDISPAEKDKYRAIYESLQPADGKLSGDQVLGSSFVYNFWAFENLSTKYRIKNSCSFKSAAQPVCLLRILF